MSGRKRKAVSYVEDSSEDEKGSDEEFQDSDTDSKDDEDDFSDEEQPKQAKSKKTNAKKLVTTKKESSKQKKAQDVGKKETFPSSSTRNTNDSTNGAQKSSDIVFSSSSSKALPVALHQLPSVGDLVEQGPPITTDAGAKKLLLQYMKQQNRPYSLLQLFDNLHKRIPKPTLERLLGVMSGPGGELIGKEYGKSRIYYIDQTILSSSLTIPGSSSLHALQEESEILRQELDGMRMKAKSFIDTVSALLQEPSDEDIDRVLMEARDRMERKQKENLQLAQKIEANPNPRALQLAIQRHNHFRHAWSQRKSLCMDAVDSIAEAMGKKNRAVIAELVLETDEESHLQLPAVLSLKDSSLR